MKNYRHDGSMDGFLTCLGEAWTSRETDCEIPATGKNADDLFAEVVARDADPTHARAFLDRLEKEERTAPIRRIIHLYYSESPCAGSLALAYLALWKQHGPSTEQRLTEPIVREVQSLTRKVAMEIHRLKGLLRFTDGEPPYLQAIIEPDYNILTPIALHFRRRLSAQRWIILDARRKRAADWDTRRLCFSTREESLPEGGSDKIAKLWQTFYRAIAIPDRKNDKLRRQNMPERYWKYLTELFA